MANILDKIDIHTNLRGAFSFGFFLTQRSDFQNSPILTPHYWFRLFKYLNAMAQTEEDIINLVKMLVILK